MEIEHNQVCLDWTVRHQGRCFYLSFKTSHGLDPVVLYPGTWEVYEDTQSGVEELTYLARGKSTPAPKALAARNHRLMKRLIRFCVADWDNRFVSVLRKELSREGAESSRSLGTRPSHDQVLS